MKKIISVLFLILFVSNAYAHKAHDDVLVQELQKIASKNASNLVRSNIKDFSLESHYTFKNTKQDQKLQEVLKANDFNKNDYISTLSEIYKGNEFAKNVSAEKSATIIAKLNKQDRIVFANVLKTINQHQH